MRRMEFAPSAKLQRKRKTTQPLNGGGSVAVTFLQNVEIVNTNDRRKPVGKGKGATKREQEQTGRLAEVTIPSHGPAQPV